MEKVEVEMAKEEKVVDQKADERVSQMVGGFEGIEASLNNHADRIKELHDLIEEDLVGAIDELKDELRNNRIIMTQSQGKKPQMMSNTEASPPVDLNRIFYGDK